MPGLTVGESCVRRRNRRPFLAALAAVAAATSILSPIEASAQASAPPLDALEPFLLTTALETALARSAAPPSVADHADLYLLGREGFERVSIGTNGFTCLVERAWHDAEVHAPICYNPVAVEYVLPVRLFEAERASLGHARAEIGAQVRDAYATGRFHPPGPGAFAYMMSEGQRLGTAGQAFPHVMVYAPYITNAAAGGHPSGSTMPTVLERPGEPSAILTIGTPEFLPLPEGQGTPATVGPGHRAALLRLLDANEASLRAATRDLTEDRWVSRPDAESWSPAEIVEHVAAAEVALFGQLQAAVGQGATHPPFRTSHPDERIRHFVLDRGARFQTVPAIVPNERYGNFPGALEALEASRIKLRSFIRDMGPDIRDHGFPSPVSDERIDGYQMLLFIVGHADRHVEQIEEALRRIEESSRVSAR